MGVTITATTGREVVAEGSTTIGLFTVKEGPVPARHIGMAAREGTMGIMPIGNKITTSAGEGMKSDIVGQWSTQSFDVGEGKLLELSIIKTIARNGRLSTPCRIVIRVRAKAPYNRLSVPLLGFARATKTAAHIEGRFDVLTHEEALAAGFVSPVAFRSMYDQTFVNRAGVTVTELEPGIENVRIETRAVTVDGEVRNVQVAKRKRALDF